MLVGDLVYIRQYGNEEPVEIAAIGASFLGEGYDIGVKIYPNSETLAWYREDELLPVVSDDEVRNAIAALRRL